MSKRIFLSIILSINLWGISSLMAWTGGEDNISCEEGFPAQVEPEGTSISQRINAGESFSSVSYSKPPAAKNVKKKVQQLLDTIPFYGGTYLGIDIAGIAASMFGSDTKSVEVQADVNLRNRYFPVVEIGYAQTDAESTYGTVYNSKGPYFRLGMNYKIKFRNRNESHLYVGARYAFSFFKYDVESVELTDPIWGGSSDPNLSDDIWGGSVPFRLTGVNSSAHWMELVFGVRVKVWKDFMLGWSIRYKQRFSVKDGDMSTPAYVPGFGANKGSTFGITYSVIYKLPI